MYQPFELARFALSEFERGLEGATDKEALAGVRLLCETEGILPALETAHAIGYLPRLTSELPEGSVIVLCLSGRGDKDVYTIREALEKSG